MVHEISALSLCMEHAPTPLSAAIFEGIFGASSLFDPRPFQLIKNTIGYTCTRE